MVLVKRRGLAFEAQFLVKELVKVEMVEKVRPLVLKASKLQVSNAW